MARVTSEVLSEQIKNLHEDFKEFKQEQFKPIAAEVKCNTEFRQRAKGIIGAASFISATVGAFFIWFIDKFWPRG